MSSIATFEAGVEASISYLQSPEAQRSMELDPYWPKWNSPWWHMTLLWEIGMASNIPKTAIQMLIDALKHRYLDFFPFTESEVPPGVDPIAGVMCHCGLGTAYQILNASGVPIDNELPWIRKWFLQYQLQDGGWNCDEAAYSRANPKSSIVSSLPILESMLLITDRSAEENAALDAGAQYLLKRRLVHSLSNDQIINPDWMQLTFPRFYEFDILRGLAVLAKWANVRHQTLPREAIAEACSTISGKLIDGKLNIERNFHKSCKTRLRHPDGSWSIEPHASEFPLLQTVSQIGAASPWLTASWNAVQGCI